MPTPNEKLAASLIALQGLQRGGRRVFRSTELSRVHRERLLQNGFVQEAIKGWLISSSPSARVGDSTPWYASFWEFCARYCEERFGAAGVRNWPRKSSRPCEAQATRFGRPILSRRDRGLRRCRLCCRQLWD